MVESGVVKIAILPADGTGTNCVDQGSIELRDHDPIVIAVRDEQASSFRVGQNLARKPQRRLGWFFGREVESQRRFVEKFLLPVVRQGPLQEIAKRLEVDFSTVSGDEIAFRIDNPQGRPALGEEL